MLSVVHVSSHAPDKHVWGGSKTFQDDDDFCFVESLLSSTSQIVMD